MDQELKKLEEELGKLTPCELNAQLLSRLDQAMSRWHEHVPVEEKIIPIESRQHSDETGSTKRFPFTWSAAAAVAILGALSASVINNRSATTTPRASTAATSAQRPANSPVMASFVPDQAHTNLVSTQDHGIVYLPNGRPARCVAVQYQDEMKFKNARGESLTVEKPDTKIIFVPLQTD